jgi:hypothetical protein
MFALRTWSHPFHAKGRAKTTSLADHPSPADCAVPHTLFMMGAVD